jgi:hypothetical protein
MLGLALQNRPFVIYEPCVRSPRILFFTNLQRAADFTAAKAMAAARIARSRKSPEPARRRRWKAKVAPTFAMFLNVGRCSGVMPRAHEEDVDARHNC